MFAPDELSVQQVLERLSELVKAAVAEKESNQESDGSDTLALDLFTRVLHRAINMVDNEEDPQRSIGIRWLSDPNNRVLFRQVVPTDQRATLFKAHLKNRYIVAMLEDNGLLSLIPEPNKVRADFVRAVLGNWIPKDDAWIRGCLSGEIKRVTLAAAVLYWLRHPEEFEDGDAFVARFLRTGPEPATKGVSWTLTRECSRMWALMVSTDELDEALVICAEREPSVFFEAPANKDDAPVWRKVYIRMLDERAQAILRLAIDNLRSRDGLSAMDFDELPKRLRQRLVERPEVCPLPLLVKFALDYIHGDGYSTFRAYVGQITPRCTNYAADLTESFEYIKDALKDQSLAPYAPATIGRMQVTLLNNAALHRVDLSKLNLRLT